jgi:replicative DNA helicase
MDELQAQVLQALLTKAGWAEFGIIITPDVIGNTNVRTLYSAISSLHQRTQGDLTPDSLAIDVSATFNGDRLDELLDLIEEIENTKAVPHDALHQSARRWAARELLTQASRYVATNLASPDLDPAVAHHLCQRAVDLTESAGGAVVDLDDTGLPGTTDDRPGLCPFGLSDELDTSLGGGVASGELAVFLAPPARGKTSYLVAVGAKAAQAGKHVLHITLEISTRRVGRRYDSTLTGLKSSDLIGSVKAVAAARKKVKKNGGSIHIKDWSYTDVTPNDIRGLVKGMRASGQSVDLVIVDYLELLQPSSTGENYGRREQRHVYGQLGKQMRAMAVCLDVPVITAWQVNREGSDMHNVELRHVSESWDIIKHSDQIISLNQTDAERDERVMRLRVLKQRDSTDRSVFYVHSDLDRMVIRGSQAGGDPIDKPTLHSG